MKAMKNTKNMMKKALCLLLALAAASGPSFSASAEADDSLSSVKAAGKLVVVTSPDYAPYEFLGPDGEPVGADISMIRYVAEQLGVELQLESMDFDTALAAVAAGKADLCVAGMVPKAERAEMMDFSDIYYNDGQQGIVILKSNAGQLRTLADFSGKTVAAQNGTLQQTLVSEQIPDAKMEPIAKIPDAIMMVMSGKADGVALATVVADNYVANYPELALCESYFDYTSLGVVMAAPKGSGELIGAVNGIIAQMEKEGLYLKWMEEAVELSASLSQ